MKPLLRERLRPETRSQSWWLTKYPPRQVAKKLNFGRRIDTETMVEKSEDILKVFQVPGAGAGVVGRIWEDLGGFGRI